MAAQFSGSSSNNSDQGFPLSKANCTPFYPKAGLAASQFQSPGESGFSCSDLQVHLKAQEWSPQLSGQAYKQWQPQVANCRGHLTDQKQYGYKVKEKAVVNQFEVKPSSPSEIPVKQGQKMTVVPS